MNTKNPFWFGYRYMSDKPKQAGYFGPINAGNGDVITEFSADSNIGGKNVQYPLVVPTLSWSDLQDIISASRGEAKVPESVYGKAEDWAKYRMAIGRSPFWSIPEKQYEPPKFGLLDTLQSPNLGLLGY